MPKMSVKKVQEFVQGCTAKQALSLLKKELAGDNRKAAVLAIFDAHGPALVGMAAKGSVEAPRLANDLGKLELIGTIATRSRTIAVGDAAAFDVVWNHRSLGRWALYIRDQPLLTQDKAIVGTLKSWGAEKLADGTLRVLCEAQHVAAVRKKSLETRLKLADGKVKGMVAVRSTNASHTYMEDAARETGTAFVEESNGFTFAARVSDDPHIKISRTKDGRLVIG